MSKVSFLTKEGETVECPVDIASRSVMVKGMIDDGNVEEAIPLPTVSKDTLEKVIEFCAYLKDN